MESVSTSRSSDEDGFEPNRGRRLDRRAPVAPSIGELLCADQLDRYLDANGGGADVENWGAELCTLPDIPRHKPRYLPEPLARRTERQSSRSPGMTGPSTDPPSCARIRSAGEPGHSWRRSLVRTIDPSKRCGRPVASNTSTGCDRSRRRSFSSLPWATWLVAVCFCGQSARCGLWAVAA